MRTPLCLFIFLVSSTVMIAQNEGQMMLQGDTLTTTVILESLPEIMVKGERPIAKLERGQLSFNMTLLLDKMPAENAYEALKRIPGISEQSGSIIYAARPVTLIIDGKITTLSSEQVIERLKSMPAEQLAKAEIMLSAPARYHTRGAMINIITKDYLGSHQTAAQLVGCWNQGKYGDGTFKANVLSVNDQFSIDASYSYNNGKEENKATHKAFHPFGNIVIPYSDCTRNVGNFIIHNYRIGSSYSFSKDHSIRMDFTGKWANTDFTNTTTGTSNSFQKNKAHNYLHNVDLNYTLPIGLQINASYTNYEYPKNQILVGRLNNISTDLQASSNQQINKWLLTADQSHSFKQGWGLTYGIMAQITQNDSYQTTQNASGEIMPDATSKVNLEEKIFNGYVGISKQFGEDINMEGSLSFENFHSNKWNLCHLFASFNTTWNINDNHLLDLSFSSNAEYPDYWSTMSSIHYSSIYSEIWGNPELKPSNSYDLSLMWQVRRHYMLVAFAKIMPAYFIQLPYQPSDRLAVIMKETNFNYNNNYGVQASSEFNANNWLNGNLSVTVLYAHTKNNKFFDIPFNRKKVSGIFSGNANILFSEKHHISCTLNPFLQTPAIQGVYDIRTLFRMDASLRWTSQNDHWNLILSGNNVFDGYFNTTSRWANQHFSMSVWQNRASVSLTAIYKIGNYKEKANKEIDTSRMGY